MTDPGGSSSALTPHIVTALLRDWLDRSGWTVYRLAREMRKHCFVNYSMVRGWVKRLHTPNQKSLRKIQTCRKDIEKKVTRQEKVNRLLRTIFSEE